MRNSAVAVHVIAFAPPPRQSALQQTNIRAEVRQIVVDVCFLALAESATNLTSDPGRD